MVNCPGGTATLVPSALYPRRIDLHRSKANAAQIATVGATGYSGREASTAPSNPEGEIVLLTGINCQIESRGVGRSTGQMTLPGNVSRNPQWRIMTQPLPLGTIRDDDIVIDDEGYRYQVALNFWTGLGYSMDCIRLET